jgi:NRPS condensation-like uncharacterized protein
MKRKLMIMERILHDNGKTPFNEVIPFRIKGHFTETALHYALSRLQEKHPWLNAFVQNDKKGHPYFVVDEQKPIKIPVRIVERTSDEDWQTESVKEWATVFDTNTGPLMRLVLIKGQPVSDILLVFHHCLCDGVAATSILSELLQVLDNAKAEIGKETPITSLSDIIPTGILYSKSKQIKAKFIGGMMILALWLIPVKKKAVDRQKDYLINWELDEQLYQSLISFCKQQGITVNTILCAVILDAFKQIRLKKAHNKISCPVDIRKFAPQIKADQIFAYGLMLVVSAFPGLEFLSNVKAIQKDVDKKTARFNPYAIIMTMEAAHAGLSKFVKVLKYSKSNNDCMFSNLGKIDIPHQYQLFEVETIFAPSVIGPLGNTTTLISSTYRDRMNFTFVSSEGFVPYMDALAIKDKIISIIQEQTAHLTPIAITI